MAMKVKYNAEAQLSLGELNKNTNQAGKALAKVTSGMKINSAQDDASGYSISERMRVQLRALQQDNQNVQNGSSMIRVAERGIIIQNMRTMKERAINAANDHNTDEDRATIQKEFNQLRNTINDIALGTQYNGKILLDGRYDVPPWEGEPSIENAVNSFRAAKNATEQTTSPLYNGGTGAWKFEVDKSFTHSGTPFSVELNFSGIKVAGNSYPDGLHNQGFSIMCGGCPQYINIVFDANKTTAQSTYDKTSNTLNGQTNSMAREFVIGVKDVESSKDLAEAIFQDISAVSDSIPQTSSHTNTADDLLVDISHVLRIRRDPSDPSKILLTKKKWYYSKSQHREIGRAFKKKNRFSLGSAWHTDRTTY